MYFITTKRMLEVCVSAHPNIQYRTAFFGFIYLAEEMHSLRRGEAGVRGLYCFTSNTTPAASSLPSPQTYRTLVHDTINPNHSTSFNPHSGDATKE